MSADEALECQFGWLLNKLSTKLRRWWGKKLAIKSFYLHGKMIFAFQMMDNGDEAYLLLVWKRAKKIYETIGGALGLCRRARCCSLSGLPFDDRFRAHNNYNVQKNNKCFLELASAGSARQHSWPMIHLTADASRAGEIPESTTYLAGWAMNLIWKPFRTIGFCGYWIPMLSTVTVQKERKSSVDRGGILNYTASRRCVMNKGPENIISTGRTYFPFPERNNSPCNYKEFNVITF